MHKIVLPLVIFATILVAVLHAPPAQAQARVFVSAQGADGNPCTFVSPCRTFQHAHDIAPANGEIDVIDPAGYGVLTITKAISIQGHGFGGITVANVGITINAGATDNISLRGLLLDGVNTGNEGIMFNSGASLNVQDCVLRGLGDAIEFEPTTSSKLSVSNTLVADNSNIGIAVRALGSGTVTGVLDNVESTNNGFGILINGGISTGSLQVTINNSVIAASNVSDGVEVASQGGSGATNVMVRATTVANNAGIGLHVSGVSGSPTILRVTRSTITGNNVGLRVTGIGTLSSYGDNNINDNSTDGTPTNIIALH